jgi:hypothetical protein
MKLHEISDREREQNERSANRIRIYQLHKAHKEHHASQIGSAGFKTDSYAFDRHYMSDEEWLEDNKITIRIETHMHNFVKWLIDSFHLQPSWVSMRLYSTINGTYKFNVELPGARFQKPDDLTVDMMVKHIPAKMKQLVPEISVGKYNDLYVHRTKRMITISGQLSAEVPEARNRWLQGLYNYNPEKLTADGLKQHNEYKRQAYGEMMLRKAIKAGEIEND